MDDVEEIGAYYRAILPFYDASLAGRGDLPFWESIARRWNPRNILDLGCGTGRVTEVLARVASVTAADVLIEMLERARTRLPGVNFFVADLRTFAFTSPFDLIVLADDPMSHVIATEDRRRAIRRLAEHLKPGGRLVIEGLYRPRAKQLVEFEESWEPSGTDCVWNATYRYGSVEAKTTLRSWSIGETAMFGDAGLHIESFWGDFDERPFHENSERIVIVATAH